MGARHRDCDGGLGPRNGGWLQKLTIFFPTKQFRRALPEIVSTCCRSATRNYLEPTGHTIPHAGQNRIVEELEYNGPTMWATKCLAEEKNIC